MATQAEVATHLDLAIAQVGRLVASGVLPKAPSGELDLDACRVAYIHNLRKAASGRSDALNTERVKLTKLSLKERRLALQKRRGELGDIGLMTSAVFTIFRNFRDAWLQWHARVAVAMAAELEVEPRKLAEVLSRHVEEHLRELGEPNADFSEAKG